MENIKAIGYEDELRFMACYTLDYDNIETGGDLFGFWNKEGSPVIKYVTGPGKETKRTSVSFYQDIEYLHRCGEYLHSRYALEHIGSWHSHHRLSLNEPSGGDINTMKNCFKTQNIDNFFIVICNIVKDDTVSINGFLFSKFFDGLYKPAEWAVLPDASPIRKEVELQSSLFIAPKTKKARFRFIPTNLSPTKNIVFEKVELPLNSYFDSKEGHSFLKKEFEKIKANENFKDVELVQNKDNTIGITFTYQGKELEIRYPLDFSEKNPNPMLIEKDNQGEIKKHTIEVLPNKVYFIKPFDMFLEIKNRFSESNNVFQLKNKA